jgi:hypothetical protein
MNTIPQEIYNYILSFLPLTILIRLSTVSKRWQQIAYNFTHNKNPPEYELKNEWTTGLPILQATNINGYMINLYRHTIHRSCLTGAIESISLGRTKIFHNNPFSWIAFEIDDGDFIIYNVPSKVKWKQVHFYDVLKLLFILLKEKSE